MEKYTLVLMMLEVHITEAALIGSPQYPVRTKSLQEDWVPMLHWKTQVVAGSPKLQGQHEVSNPTHPGVNEPAALEVQISGITWLLRQLHDPEMTDNVNISVDGIAAGQHDVLTI